MSVVVDVQGIQSRTFGERGVARYLVELTSALERGHPSAVERYLVNPELPVCPALDALKSAGRIGTVDDIAPSTRVYHLGSAFEPDVSIDGLWPPAAQRRKLVVTLYDLIPELFPETYLSDPRIRRWYRTRLELVRRADRLLAISAATAADAADLLRLPPGRVIVVGAAASSRFVPPASRKAALEDARHAIPEIEPGFLLYTGGIEPRKNIERLLQAYARLGQELRRDHQLVVVCRVLPEERTRLEERLRDLGVADRVLFTGYVTDDQLVSLYGATTLFVFPSLYEGYGLPVAEAAACGAPVVASNTSSLVELVVDQEARFDPYEVESIRSTIDRALTEPSLLERLRDPSAYVLDSWRDVAARTVAVYDELEAEPERARHRARWRPRIAYVSPLPPQRSGIADYSYRLLQQLSRLCEVDAFADRSLGAHEGPPGVHVSPIRAFDVVERLRGGYDQVLICLGNSEHHIAALDLLRRRGGVVLAHDVRLTGMYGFASIHRPELEPRPLQQILKEMYDGAVPAALALAGGISLDDAHRHEVFMAREAISLADGYFVHSEFAAQLARDDAAPADRHKVRVAPFAFPPPAEFAASELERPLVGTFGVVAPVKRTETVIDAFSAVTRKRPDSLLLVAGPPAGAGDYERLEVRVAELGLGDHVRLLGDLDAESYRRTVARTTVAVQLREMSMGESPASVADCLAAGVPTIASAVGAVRELPDDAVVKVAPDVQAEPLGELVLALMNDAPRRTSLRSAGQALARDRSFEHAAQFLRENVLRRDHAAA